MIINAQGGRIGLMRVCTIERWSASDQARERLQWHTVVCRNEKFLPLLEHGLTAGQKVLVRGQLEHRSYTDGATRKERWVSEIVVHPIGGSIIECGGYAVAEMTGLPSCTNEVMLVGKLGAKPTVHDFQNGGKICVARMATSERFKGRAGNEDTERVQWHTVVCRNEALIPFMVRCLETGSMVVVHGQVEYRPFGGDETRAERLVTEVVIRPYSGSIIGCDRSSGNGRMPRVPSDRNPGLMSGSGAHAGSARFQPYDDDMDDEQAFVPSRAVA